MRDLSKFALIYSHNGYWRKNCGGYTNDIGRAGIYDLSEAERLAAGCGPEKGVQLCPVNDDHPVIVAEERDALRAVVRRIKVIAQRQVEGQSQINEITAFERIITAIQEAGERWTQET